MCGIAGFIAAEGNLLPNSIITQMVDLINHRGPDDEGFLFITKQRELLTAIGKNTPRNVKTEVSEKYSCITNEKIFGEYSSMAFGHKRLSIIDLTPAGHQPMPYSNENYWIIFNGEIYNYKEIKRELINLGYVFHTKTDTEVILCAYVEWGEECLNKFVGMWAFVIFNRITNEIFFSRDRYGIKPLYYYFSPKGDFYFASEIKQFTILEDWKPRINGSRVYDQLIYSFADHTDETMFSDVYQLPGGTFFKAKIDSVKPNSVGKLVTQKWYSFQREQFNGSIMEAASVFRSLFEHAVSEHLEADVPVGTALSGGLDSSAIVCEVNRILMSSGSESLQKTFSSCSKDERFSEKMWMDIVIDSTRVDSYFTYPELLDSMNLTSKMLWNQDEPFQSQSVFLGYNVFKLAKENNVTVLLNGQGADEYLGGYGQFTIPRYAELLKQMKLGKLIIDSKNQQKYNQISKSNLIINSIVHLLPIGFKNTLNKFKNNSDSVKGIIDSKRLNIDPVHPYNSIPVSYRSVPEVSEHLTFHSTLPKYLHWEDRNSMINSVEARVPFLDHRLVEFAFSLPDDYLEKDGITKRVMREAMHGLLPDRINYRKDKQGFLTPEEKWVREENPSLFRDRISDAIDLANGIIKPSALKYYDKVVAGELPFDYTYWRLILFSEWIKRFNISV